MFRLAALTFSFFATALASAAPPANVLVKDLDAPKMKPRTTFQLPGKRFQDGAGYLSADGSILAVGVVATDEKAPSRKYLRAASCESSRLRRANPDIK